MSSILSFQNNLSLALGPTAVLQLLRQWSTSMDTLPSFNAHAQTSLQQLEDYTGTEDAAVPDCCAAAAPCQDA